MAPSGSTWLAQVELALEAPPEPTPPGSLCLEALPESVARLRLSRGVPECVRSAAKSGDFCVVVQEPAAATAWVRLPAESGAARLAEEEGVEVMDRGVRWCALRIGRPGAAKERAQRGPAPTGAAASVCAALSEAGVGARFLSAFGSEVLLLPEDVLPSAASALVALGHAVWPVARVGEPSPATSSVPSDPALMRKLAGAWALVRREAPPGGTAQEFSEGDGPLRVQVPSGLFVEVRAGSVRTGGAHERRDASFGGRCLASVAGGQASFTQVRAIDLQPPAACAPAACQVSCSSKSQEVVGAGARESWKRLGEGEDFAALELVSLSPARALPRQGLWLFAGGRFARLLGPPRGTGLVAGTCCKSLGQLQKLRGYADVRQEVLEHYDVVVGEVVEPGLLRARRLASQADKSERVFYDASDATGSCGEVVVGDGRVEYTSRSGVRETWRIVEWTFDPFTSVGAARADRAASASTSQTRAQSQSSAGPTDVEEAAPCIASPSREEAPAAAEAETEGQRRQRKRRRKDGEAPAKAEAEDTPAQTGKRRKEAPEAESPKEKKKKKEKKEKKDKKEKKRRRKDKKKRARENDENTSAAEEEDEDAASQAATECAQEEAEAEEREPSPAASPARSPSPPPRPRRARLTAAKADDRPPSAAKDRRAAEARVASPRSRKRLGPLAAAAVAAAADATAPEARRRKERRRGDAAAPSPSPELRPAPGGRARLKAKKAARGSGSEPEADRRRGREDGAQKERDKGKEERRKDRAKENGKEKDREKDREKEQDRKVKKKKKAKDLSDGAED